MMLLSEQTTKTQIAYHLAAAVIVAADERDHWCNIAKYTGQDWADNMQYKCSKRIKYAVEKAREMGVYLEMLKITETLLMADEQEKMK